MANKDIALIAHLMRRAGFGAPREELETRISKGYEKTVEELLDPDAHGIPSISEAEILRYMPSLVRGLGPPIFAQGNWMYRMLNTPRPLEEKMVLFWHQVFATGASKVDNSRCMTLQISMFRRCGMGNYRDLLLEVAKDPTMLFWLDNNENHKHAPNENWGRELLELFSMGQGNYTEKDVFECSRAFTGWSIAYPIPRAGYGSTPWYFEYRPEDHDDGEKEFLSHRGRFNGEDIINIIVQQPATAQFIARHLYNFFVADEVQVPSWRDVPPKDPEAVGILADAFVSSGYDIRSTLKVLFTSDFFKDEGTWYSKVKSPAEVVVGTMRLVGDYQGPKPGICALGQTPGYMGQDILDPPSVEGWHTGQEWIDSGALLQRVNFVADRVNDTTLLGVKAIVDRLSTMESMTAAEFVDGCLDLMGPVRVFDETRKELIAQIGGPSVEVQSGGTEDEHAAFAQQVSIMLQLIASTREYQFA